MNSEVHLIGRPARAIGSHTLSIVASGLIVASVVVLFLYMGREILEPLVIAALLSFILAPLIRRLRSWGLWRVPSVVLTVSFAIAVIAALGATIALQVTQLAEDLQPKGLEGSGHCYPLWRPRPLPSFSSCSSCYSARYYWATSPL
jgi:AI-2E family transporter